MKANTEKARKRTRGADPVLTYSNILFQAKCHRTKNNIESTDLGVILEHMTRTTYWTPSVAIMRRGLTKHHYTLFKRLCKS